MRMTHFKNANVDVSQLAVGTWGLDSLRWNGAMSEDEAIAAIRAMIQGGGNLIDTAPNYGNHSSEQIVGKAIQGLNRSEIYMSTKFGTHNDLFTGGVFRDAAHQTADILLLFFVGRLLVNLVLGGTAREALVRQLLIQKLLNRQFGEAQLIGQMRGDLSCGAACHIPASFSLSRFVINQT